MNSERDAGRPGIPDEPTTVRMPGWKIDLKTGAQVRFYSDVGSDKNLFIFTSKEGRELPVLLSDAACDAVFTLLQNRERLKSETVIWTCVVGADGKQERGA